MDRFLRKTAATPSVQFTTGGVAVDPGVVTIEIVREDGTTLVAAGTATSGSGANPRTFALTTTHTAELDVLTLTWTSATLGTLTTYVEVVGGFLFSIAQARALTPLDDTTTYPTADLLTARTLAEAALEDACGVAFVPRYFRTKVDGSGGEDVLLSARPLTVTSAAVGVTSASAGTTLTAGELADLELYDDGRVYNPLGWARGRRNVELRGSRGYTTPPPRVGRAALLLAKRWLVETPISDRATSLTTDSGTVEYVAVAGVKSLVFDVPECNAVVEEYGVQSAVG